MIMNVDIVDILEYSGYRFKIQDVIDVLEPTWERKDVITFLLENNKIHEAGCSNDLEKYDCFLLNPASISESLRDDNIEVHISIHGMQEIAELIHHQNEIEALEKSLKEDPRNGYQETHG